MYINERSLEIVNNFNNKTFHILGCGAIGSSAATQITRMGGAQFVLYDMDVVEVQNVGVSHYILKDIGKKKVNALELHIKSINSDSFIVKYHGEFIKFPKQLDEDDIVILGFDNMRTRLLAAKEACKANPGVLIDGRMGAEEYQQHSFYKPTLKRYTKHWYTDGMAKDAPCNAKATSYCSNMAGAFIANGVRKALTDQPLMEEMYFSFPQLTLARR